MKNENIKQAIPSELNNPWYDLSLQAMNKSSIAYIEKNENGNWLNDRLDLEFKQEILTKQERAIHYSFCNIYGFSKENIAAKFARTAINNKWILPNTIGKLIENFTCWCDALDNNRNSPSFINTVYAR